MLKYRRSRQGLYILGFIIALFYCTPVYAQQEIVVIEPQCDAEGASLKIPANVYAPNGATATQICGVNLPVDLCTESFIQSIVDAVTKGSSQCIVTKPPQTDTGDNEIDAYVTCFASRRQLKSPLKRACQTLVNAIH